MMGSFLGRWRSLISQHALIFSFGAPEKHPRYNCGIQSAANEFKFGHLQPLLPYQHDRCHQCNDIPQTKSRLHLISIYIIELVKNIILVFTV